MACKDTPNGKCKDLSNGCESPFDLTKSGDACFIDEVVNESLAIGGADINVFKLLGIHERGQLVDLIGNGHPISGGDANTYPASNAYNNLTPEWRSLQKGSQVAATSYIGYDFGMIKDDVTEREVYGIDTRVKYHITTLIIKQHCDPKYRITKARIERSKDGVNWYGVDIITLPDDGDSHQISFKESVPSRFWRIRPLEFNGGPDDFWGVVSLEMYNYIETRLSNIQDEFGFLESRDRDYAHESILLKGSYDLIDIQTELSRFGIDLPSQQYYIQMAFSTMVEKLGRPVVIGDIFELPSETQYAPDLTPVKKFLEVTDVGWSTEGYTPGWKPTMMRIITQPMLASQETLDIIGDFAPTPDATGFLDIDSTQHTDITNLDHRVEADANTAVPEKGTDTIEIAQATEQQIADDPRIEKVTINPRGLYIEDGLPPEGIPYTEGDELPDVSSVNDGDYHRLTYTNIDTEIPPRLFKFSLAKNRWVYVETDRRFEFRETKPLLQKKLKSTTAIAPEDLGK